MADDGENDLPYIDDEDDEEDIVFWSERQKELVTAQADYNLGTLRDLANDNTIDMKPHFQRRFRWDNDKKSKLIESLLLNVPIPPIYLNEDRYGKYSIIDGKQRISSVQDFLDDKFQLTGLKIFSDLNGKRYSGLPKQIQPILRTRPTLRAIIVLRQSDPAVKYEVFQRLNTGGVPLNAQEIRNNLFSGSLNTLVNQEGESAPFHKALGISDKEKSAIYREMRDSELVLRFLTFSEDWETFRGGVKLRMDSFSETYKNAKQLKIEEFRLKFRSTLDKATTVFGEHVFQRWIPDKSLWRNQVLASVYDAQMLSLQYFRQSDLEANRNAVVIAFQNLFKEPEFLKSIDAATNTPSYLKFRVARLKRAIEESLL